MLPFLTKGLNGRVFNSEIDVEVLMEKGSLTRDMVAKLLRPVVAIEEGNCYHEKANKMSDIFGDKELQDRYADKCVEYLQMKC